MGPPPPRGRGYGLGCPPASTSQTILGTLGNPDGSKCKSSQGTARKDRRRRHGLQAGARGGSWRLREGGRLVTREGCGGGRRARRPGRIRRLSRFVYTCGRQAWRVNRSQLRNRFLREVG